MTVNERLNSICNRLRRPIQDAVRTVVRHRGLAGLARAIGVAAGLAWLAGCSASGSSSSASSAALAGDSSSPPRLTRAPARVVGPAGDDARVRQAASDELGPDAAASVPQVQPGANDAAETAEPIDSGAQALVASIAQALSIRPSNPQGATVIALDDLRNYSRAGHGEFNYFLKRLARLLSDAGRDERLEFVVVDASMAGPAELRPHYRMQGAAYLINAQGFDQWELFLSIAPIDRDLAMWDARSATRVLRTERPGVTQITFPTPPGKAAP